MFQLQINCDVTSNLGKPSTIVCLPSNMLSRTPPLILYIISLASQQLRSSIYNIRSRVES